MITLEELEMIRVLKVEAFEAGVDEGQTPWKPNPEREKRIENTLRHFEDQACSHDWKTYRGIRRCQICHATRVA